MAEIRYKCSKCNGEQLEARDLSSCQRPFMSRWHIVCKDCVFISETHGETPQEAWLSFKLPQANARIAELEGKIPKTADGVTVTPGLRVYQQYDIGVLEEYHILDWAEVHDRFVDGSGMYYSTREAARAAANPQSDEATHER